MYVSVAEFAGAQRMWMMLTFFVAFPFCGLAYYTAMKNEEKERHRPRREFVPYAHLRIRTKVNSYKNCA